MSDKRDVYYSTTSLLFDWDYLPEGDDLVHSTTDLIDLPTSINTDTIKFTDDWVFHQEEPISRPLTENEISKLFKVFGTELYYDRITVIVDSIYNYNRWPLGEEDVSRGVFNRLCIRSEDIVNGEIKEDALIHEAAHVWQYQRTMGRSYAKRAIAGHIRSRLTKGRYDPYDYLTFQRNGIPWDEWNPEAQAQWIQDKRRLPYPDMINPPKGDFFIKKGFTI